MTPSGVKYLAVGIVLVGGIGTVTYFNRAKRGNGELVQAVERERAPVRVLTLQASSIEEILEHTGVLEADRDITITAEVSGKIRRKLKRMGDACNKGEALFQLDAESYRIAQSQAQAQLKQSQIQRIQAARDHRRTATLAQRKVIAGAALDRADTALKTSDASVQRADAALRLARRNLRETIIRCPFSGRVAETMADLGQVIVPQAPLARLVDTSQLKLKLKVSSAELARLEVGQTVSLHDPSLPADRRRTFTGKIARLGVAADPATRTFPVEVTVPGDSAPQQQQERMSAAPRPGQVVRSMIVIAHHRDVLVVPESAVAAAPGGERTVHVVEQGRVARRTVSLGAHIRDRVVVTRGLRPGEQVIVAGQHGLKPGAAVTAVNASPTTGAAEAATAGAKRPPQKK